MTSKSLLSVLLLILTVSISAAEKEPGPIAPFKIWKDVESPQLKAFKAPVADRYQLPNGMVVFLLEDHELPLIDLSMTLRVGDIHEPAEKAGLADATASVMRSGGSVKYPGDKLDEILEDMAASVSVGIGTDSGSASLSTLKEDFDKGLQILVDVLRNPAFPDDKIDLHLTQARTAVSKRNDSPNSIIGREFKKALYGKDSPYAKHTDYATLSKIDRKTMLDFHSKYFHPNMFIMGIVGDFKKDEMLEKIKKAFSDWPMKEVALPAVKQISTKHSKRVIFIDRPKINQTTFSMGHVIDIRRDNPEYAAIQMLNEILSGGMSARMFTEVRTKKGLAYSVWGHAAVNYDRPGSFYCTALTRNEQALESVDAVKEELTKVIAKGVTPEELAIARDSILNSFVFNFDTPSKVIGRQITYEFYKYPTDFAEKLLEQIKKVTVDEVNAVARKYLDPDNMVLLGVGNSAEIEEAKSFKSIKDVQILDVTIPIPKSEPMIIDSAREQAGRKLLSEAMQAAGGLEIFQTLDRIRADVILHTKGMKLRGCLRGEMPFNARLDVATPFSSLSQVINKDAAWKASGGSVQELKPAEALKNLRTLIQSDIGVMRMLAQAKEGYNVQGLDPIKEGGQDLVGVEIESLLLGRVKIWFDAKTKLMQKLRYHAEGTQKEYDKIFSEHTQFGKVTVARMITDKDPAGAPTIELKSLQLNPTFDANLFSRPEKATSPPKD